MISKFKIQNSELYTADRIPPIEIVGTGIALLDQVLPNGGIPKGRLTEVQGPMMGGKITLAQTLIAQTLAAGQRAAFIDLPGMFYPFNLPENDRLLVAKPADWKQALRAADILVSSGEWGFVGVDLTGHAQAVAAEICHRLARSARESKTLVLLLHDHPVRTLGSLVTLRLKVNRKLTAEGRTLQVLVAKNKLAAPGKLISLPLPLQVSLAKQEKSHA